MGGIDVGITDGAEVDGSADVCSEDGLRVGTTERFNDGSYDGEVDGLNDGDIATEGFDEGNALGSAEGADNDV